MKVTVSVGGTFHAFQLAEQLERRGYLHRLVTTHRPLRGERVSRDHIVANPLPELFLQVPRRLHLPVQGDYLKAQSFDWWARRHVGGCDLFVGFAAFSLHAMRAAKARDIVTVLERASVHILSQRALLEDEYRRFGRTALPMDERLVQKQLWEYGEADYIAVPSTFVYNSFVERGFPPDRLIKVPLGADTRQFAPGTKRDNTFRILAAGTSLQKGTPYVLAAVQRLNLADLELVFLGGMGYDAADVLARHAGWYRWPGFVGQAELADLMRQGSVFVQASIQDGFGMMIPQAMAARLPVICTTNTAGPDLVREGVEGFIVPIRDSEALHDRLRYLAAHPNVCRQMGEAAAARAQEFTWDAYGDQICAQYRRLTEHPGVGSRA
jgi:glycosyltransferase involved in cell wall biosynthesis